MKKNIIDCTVIGCGIFGAEIAMKAKSHGLRVKIIEKKSDILLGASANNQNRLHLGFHYPRDSETGRQCIRGFEAFKDKYSESIQGDFLNAYFIAEEGSLTTSEDFTHFASSLGVPFRTLEPGQFPVKVKGVDTSILCDEVVYDCSILRELVWENLQQAGVEVDLGVRACDISKMDNLFKIDCINHDTIFSRVVVNATYADINALSGQLHYAVDKNQYEYTAVAIVKLDIPQVGITIMDGPFLTLLPYGKTGNFLLYCVDHSVIATKTDYAINPSWLEPRSSPFSVVDKQQYFENMINFCKQYIPSLEQAVLLGFLEGPRMVLPGKDDTDERPSLIKNFNDKYFTVFSGKIDHAIWVADEIACLLAKRFDQ